MESIWILIFTNVVTFHSQLNVQVAFPHFQRTNMSTFWSSKKTIWQQKSFPPLLILEYSHKLSNALYGFAWQILCCILFVKNATLFWHIVVQPPQFAPYSFSWKQIESCLNSKCWKFAHMFLHLVLNYHK